MNKNLEDILNSSEDNYILPFFWPLEGSPETIPEMIEKIYSSGIRAFCVEARPYEDFAGPTWWHDLKIILSEAERRNMKVWILDDKHFPTGFANGLSWRAGTCSPSTRAVADFRTGIHAAWR